MRGRGRGRGRLSHLDAEVVGVAEDGGVVDDVDHRLHQRDPNS